MYLAPLQRKIFRLFLEGLTPRQIAQKIGKEHSNVCASLKKSIDRVCQFYYNIPVYEEILRGDHGLTRKEKIILRLWKIQGKTDPWICMKRKISRLTLRDHKASISRKIGMQAIEKRRRAYSVFDSPREFASPDIGLQLLQKQVGHKAEGENSTNPG